MKSIMKINLITLVLLGCSISISSCTKNFADKPVDWSTVEPVSFEPKLTDSVKFEMVGESQLAEKDAGIMRRDPSDVIRVDSTYYIWYTKLDSNAQGYPGGWAGSVWYAKSKDGRKWEEQGAAITKGTSGSWDGYGAYTPNILPFKDKYYLAYTAQTDAEPNFKYRQAAIGMAVADLPDGPWKKLENNPVVGPSNMLSHADGFLCDDAAFIVRGDKIWLYYKGFPGQLEEENRIIRYMKKQQYEEVPGGVYSKWNTYLMAAVADGAPENGFKNVSEGQPLHRGHEVAVWPESDGGTGSLTLGCGPSLYYRSADGKHFEPVCFMTYRPFAAGLYRVDFEPGWDGQRPAWGMCMEDNGLRRFQIFWPD